MKERDLINDVFEEKEVIAVERKVLEVKLLEALQDLPEVSQVILSLYYQQGKSIPDICTELQYSPSSVRKYLKKGLHRLRRELDPLYRLKFEQVPFPISQ